MAQAEHQLNIVLVEPRIPQNTGNVARTCAATGARLHLVGPMGFTITDAKLKRAGLDYWHLLDITFYESADEFFSRNRGGEFFYFSTKGRRVFSEVEYPNNAYLVFGRDNRRWEIGNVGSGRSVRFCFSYRLRCKYSLALPQNNIKGGPGNGMSGKNSGKFSKKRVWRKVFPRQGYGGAMAGAAA